MTPLSSALDTRPLYAERVTVGIVLVTFDGRARHVVAVSSLHTPGELAITLRDAEGDWQLDVRADEIVWARS